MPDANLLPPTKAMIGKWSVDRYVVIIRRWAIGTAVLIMLMTLTEQSRALIVGIEVLAVAGIGWGVARRDGGKIESFTAGVFFGTILGLAGSVSRFIFHPTVTSATMIVVETILSAIMATLISVSATLIASLYHQRKN